MPISSHIDLGSIAERLKHSVFRQPENARLKVWRYMDLPKFIWLLTERKLAFPRLDTLADGHEGSITNKTIEWIKRSMRDQKTQDGWDVISKHFKQVPGRTFVSCWHANDHESEAMWRLYCGLGGGVAIQTTYDLLVASIEEQRDVYIGCVNYIDYETQSIPDANFYAPVMHKRISFAHENEVRLVTSPEAARGRKVQGAPTVLTIPWDYERYLEKVYVSPYAPDYFHTAVRSVINAFAPNLEARLVWSYMKAEPVF